MRTAFEAAIGISYYAGELWKIVTDPDIMEGRVSQDTDITCVVRYGQPDKNNVILSGNVPQEIKHLFEQINGSDRSMKLSDSDNLTRDSLKTSLSTLRRILDKEDPAPGYVTSFSNVQLPLKSDMRKIDELAFKLGLSD